MNYEDKIRDYCDTMLFAVEICENCLEMLDIDTDEFDSNFEEHLSELFEPKNIGNCYAEAFMETTVAFIQDKYPELKVEYYVNGYETAIEINGNLYQVGDRKEKFLNDPNKNMQNESTK